MSVFLHAETLCVSALEVQGMGTQTRPQMRQEERKVGKKYDMRGDFQTDNNKADNSVPVQASNVMGLEDKNGLKYFCFCLI